MSRPANWVACIRPLCQHGNYLSKPHVRCRPVAILNPSHQGKRSTSVRNAHKMIARGLAVIAGENAIRLLARASVFASQDAWMDDQIDAGIKRYCAGGVVNWAGCEPWKQCLPGTGHAYHRPDRGAG